MNSIGYAFNPSEHGIFVEIYLPKKAEFQGTLYQALTEGFDVDKVRSHFQAKRERINAFLRGHYNCDGRIESMQQVFYGYSMYEVDGVYYDARNKKTFEERNQVIRVMFKPGLEAVGLRALPAERVQTVTKLFVRHAGKAENFPGDHPQIFLGASEDERAEIARLLACLEAWKYDVALFVLGYIVFEICERIQELGMQKGKEAEEEILVTSFWNLTVNRIVRVREGILAAEGTGIA
ncbi:MAG: hypothetical protein FJW26_08400 [Acidimicrobiia bacterium]|nr:hypothetical protein [Acidimicrobiia bacterium]